MRSMVGSTTTISPSWHLPVLGQGEQVGYKAGSGPLIEWGRHEMSSSANQVIEHVSYLS